MHMKTLSRIRVEMFHKENLTLLQKRYHQSYYISLEMHCIKGIHHLVEKTFLIICVITCITSLCSKLFLQYAPPVKQKLNQSSIYSILVLARKHSGLKFLC